MNIEYISGPQCHVGCKAGKRARLQGQWGQNDRCEGSRSGTSSKPGIKEPPPQVEGRPLMSPHVLLVSLTLWSVQKTSGDSYSSGYQGRVIHSLILAGWGLLNCVVVN